MGKVITLAASHPLIDEVIVVDDGSSDGTSRVASEFGGVKLITFPENRGKSSAAGAGMAAAKGKYVMLLDADLEDLDAGNLSDLIYPILDGAADVTISLRKRTAPICYLLGIDYTSGERIFPRSMVEGRFEEMAKLPGFGLEVFLNDLVISERLRIKVVRWKNAFSALKWAKRGFVLGTVGEIRMRLDIYRTIGIGRIAHQIRELRRLMIRPRRLNVEYLGLYAEIPLFLLFAMRHALAAPFSEKVGNRSLIADATPLIGEFVASVPAIRSYVRNHPESSVDLLVAPVNAPLAERIIGVGRVFITGKGAASGADGMADYDRAFVLRMNVPSFRRLKYVRVGMLTTGASHFARYVPHLLWSVYKGETPVQWREINFLMLGEKSCRRNFEETFDFSQKDRERTLRKPEMSHVGNRIVVHTGTNWRMKQWGNGKWIELLNRLNEESVSEFVFVGGKSDAEDYARISSRLKFATKSLIGKIDLAELAIVLSECEYFIGIDSGPGNLAQLCGTKSVHIMGPGPHMYRPEDTLRHAVIDRTGGRGLGEMFIAREKGFINGISVSDVEAAFRSVQ